MKVDVCVTHEKLDAGNVQTGNVQVSTGDYGDLLALYPLVEYDSSSALTDKEEVGRLIENRLTTQATTPP